jgi:hypothetical protein
MSRLGPRLLLAVLALMLGWPSAAMSAPGRPAATEVRISPVEASTEISI